MFQTGVTTDRIYAFTFNDIVQTHNPWVKLQLSEIFKWREP